jgi:hypothetical protein
MMFVTTLSVAVAVVSGVIAWRVLHLERLRSLARVASLEAAIDDDSGVDEFAWETAPPQPTSPAPLFETAPRHRGPLLTAAVSLVAGVMVIVLMAMLADRDRAVPSPDPPGQDSLELLSMAHSQEGSTLIVNGVVRNPSRAATAPLTTVVTALDRDGHSIGSATAAMTPLAPGTTAPFTVRLDHITALGRYRVSFKTPTGVAPHVDRRGTRASPGVATE